MHNDSEGTKEFACGCSRGSDKKFSIFPVKSLCCDPFLVKLQSVIAYKRLLGQLYQNTDAYTETITLALSVNFEKKHQHNY